MRRHGDDQHSARTEVPAGGGQGGSVISQVLDDVEEPDAAQLPEGTFSRRHRDNGADVRPPAISNSMPRSAALPIAMLG
jgi:hypothetical protein